VEPSGDVSHRLVPASPLDDQVHVGRPNLGPRDVFDGYVDRIYASAWLTNDGPLVRELEEVLAHRAGVRHCVAMCNGTVALEIAIRAAGLTGEVIVPSFTFVATAHALQWQGITPVFADIDPTTHTLDPVSVEAAITDRTTGIIGVHLWGRTAAVEGLQDLADRRGLTLLFDAAHAFDCTSGGRPVGGSGRAEVFSFHATKFFNTFEGGAIVTNDDDLAARARLMRNFGFSGYDNVIYPGTNGKMSEVAAAMGLTNLTVLDDVVRANRATYGLYAAALDSIDGVGLLGQDPGERSNFQYIVAVVDAGRAARDRAMEALHVHGILARRYFWPGVHRMEPYVSSTREQTVPLTHTTWVADRVLVLPGGPTITPKLVVRIADVLKQVLDEV
jgi:dTDP-4-amino-4,6-dideoxygalactose transaminase